MTDRTPKPCHHPQANHIHGTYRAYMADRCRCWPCNAAYCAYARAKARLRREKGPLKLDAAPARAHLAKLKELGWSHETICRVADLPNGTVQDLTYGDRRTVVKSTMERVLSLPLTPPTMDVLPPFAPCPSVGARRRVEALVCNGWSINQIARMAHLSKRTISEMSWREMCTIATHNSIASVYDQVWDKQPPTDTRPALVAASRSKNWAKRNNWAPPLAWDDDTIDDPTAEPQHQLPDINPNEAAARETFRRFHEDLTELLRTMPVEEACRALGVTPRAAYDRYVKRAPNDPIRFLFTRDMRRNAS